MSWYPSTEELRRRFEAAARSVSNGSGGDIRRFYEGATERDLRAAYDALCPEAAVAHRLATAVLANHHTVLSLSKRGLLYCRFCGGVDLGEHVDHSNECPVLAARHLKET